MSQLRASAERASRAGREVDAWGCVGKGGQEAGGDASNGIISISQ